MLLFGPSKDVFKHKVTHCNTIKLTVLIVKVSCTSKMVSWFFETSESAW